MKRRVKRSSEAEELARLHVQFRHRLTEKEYWLRRQQEANETPHAGRRRAILSLECDAPAGTCLACERLAGIGTGPLQAITAFNRAAAELAAYSQHVRTHQGSRLSMARGALSRQRSLKELLTVFGARDELRRSVVVARLRTRLGGLSERQIRRQLLHPQVGSALAKAGKKIV